MNANSKVELTRSSEMGHGLIKADAFLRLYEQMPGVVGEVIQELAENGDMESCRAALSSGLLDKKEAADWSYSVLPLFLYSDEQEGVREFVIDWLKATGGDNQERLDKRLLSEPNPLMIHALMDVGARIGPQDSNGENALAYALSQGDAGAIRELVRGCNSCDVVPMWSDGISMIKKLASLNEAYAVHFVDSVFDGRESICDAIRAECGNVASQHPEKELKPAIRLALMTVAKMSAPKGWEEAMRLGHFLKNSDSEFFKDERAQTKIIENMLADGLSINHRFFNAAFLKDANGQSSGVQGTLLHAAAYRGDTNMVMRLLDMGADPDYKCRSRTAREIASSDETKSAFNAFVAKKNVERVLLKTKIEAILYPPEKKNKKSLQQ